MSIFKKIKTSIYKIRYVDKTKTRLFVILGFILVFILFAGSTYSDFLVSDEKNAINIKIADLNYTLFNDVTKGSSSIDVDAKETKIVNFTLTSRNRDVTKYALYYNTTSQDIKVYYSHNQKNNMSGIIGTDGASINLRVVITNLSDSQNTVNFDIKSGYASQEDLMSNITEGYYEEPLVKRTVLLDENFDNATVAVSNPSSDSDYLYFDTLCTEDAKITWNPKENDIDIDTNAANIACDIYFKKASRQDIELVYRVNSIKDLTIIKEGNIDYNKYKYLSSHCNNDSIIAYDEITHEVTIKNVTKKTLCVVNLEPYE